VVLSTHFADAQSIDNTLSISVALMIVQIAGVVVSKRKKKSPTSKRKLIFEKVVFALNLGLVSFVLLISGISRITLKTIWGFPENIIDWQITITFLHYVWLTALASSMCLLFYALILLYHE
jgi:hypothetical protein